MSRNSPNISKRHVMVWNDCLNVPNAKGPLNYLLINGLNVYILFMILVQLKCLRNAKFLLDTLKIILCQNFLLTCACFHLNFCFFVWQRFLTEVCLGMWSEVSPDYVRAVLSILSTLMRISNPLIHFSASSSTSSLTAQLKGKFRRKSNLCNFPT